MKRLAALVMVAACGGGDSTPIDAPAADGPACVPASTTKVVYLNRTGGAYTMGTDDSRTNVSSVVPNNVTLPAPTIIESEWTAYLDCVKSKFTPFAVTFTEVDPGILNHVELVIIDMPQQIGGTQGTGSLAPFDCKEEPNAIAFQMWGAVAQADRCWIGAAAIGNTFGLDHTFACPDLMTFLSNCGATADKTFTDLESDCGEFSARNCCSGVAKQNSFQKLQLNAGTSCN